MHQSQLPAVSKRRALSLDDKPLFDQVFAGLREPSSDTSFAACYLWSETLAMSWSVIEGHLCVFSGEGCDLSMLLPPCPLGPEHHDRLGRCLDACFSLMDAQNTAGRSGVGKPGPSESNAHTDDPASQGVPRSRIEYATDELAERMLGADGPAISLEPMFFDYLYPTEAMISLEGGALKGKRKLRNGFERDYPGAWTGELTEADVPECVALLARWKADRDRKHEGESNDRLIETDVFRDHDEHFTLSALRHWRALGLETLVLRAEPGGAMLGFTLGERLRNADGTTAASILIEKVDPCVRGGPQFIFSEFCRLRFADCELINAGDDWGIPSLRATKASYRPCRLLNKSTAIRTGVSCNASVPPESVRRMTARRQHVGVSDRRIAEDVEVRRATRDDLPAIIEVEQLAFAPTDRFTRQQIRRLIDNPRAVVLVAQRMGRLDGVAVTLTRRARVGCSGRLYTLGVRPDAGGLGIGRALAERAMHELGEAGVERVYLEVRATNERAIALYRSLGFVPLRTLPGYYDQESTPTDGIRMRLARPAGVSP